MKLTKPSGESPAPATPQLVRAKGGITGFAGILVGLSAKVLLIIIILATVAFSALPASASVACTVTVTPPHTVLTSTDTQLVFDIQNTGVVGIKWLRITLPFNEVAIAGSGVSGGWGTTTNADTITLTNQTLFPASIQQIRIIARTWYDTAPTGHWLVQTSSVRDGSNPVTCSGDTSFTVIQNPDIPTPTIQTLIERIEEAGFKPGLVTSLTTKIQAASLALEREHNHALPLALRILDAFQLQLRAQRNKGIPDATFGELRVLTQDIIQLISR